MAIFYVNQAGNVLIRADQIKSIVIDEAKDKFKVVLRLPRGKSVSFAELDSADAAKSFVVSMPERSIKL